TGAANVFNELKEFVITKSIGVAVTPQIIFAGSANWITERFFPFYAVLQCQSFYDTTTWPAHESRFQIGQQLCYIGTHAIFPLLKCSSREYGNIIHPDHAGRIETQYK